MVVVVIGALIFFAAKGFGEKVSPVAILQPAEAPSRGWLSSEMPAIQETVYAIAQKAKAIYVATRKGVFRSFDEGASWQRIFSAGIWSGGVQALAVHPANPTLLYIGAGRSLFVLDEQSGRSSRIFKAGQPILSVAIDLKNSKRILIGTQEGLSVSDNGGAGWARASYGLPAGAVYAAAFCGGGDYALTDSGLYFSIDSAKSWQRVWVKRQEETEAEVVEDAQEEQPMKPRALAADAKSGKLYLADGSKVFVSDDEGRNWAPLRENIPAGPIYALAVDRSGKHLQVGTPHGLFRIPLPVPAPPHPGLLPPGEKAVKGGEPSIQEVHQVAIRYAEVMPEKINGWRLGAAVRNFIPKLTVGLGRDRNQTIASSTSSGKTTFSVGPQDESVSLDLGFTWDLANLVWSTDQTSIDVRSRLMVQLRQDILEEVNRVYFERRKLLTEFEGNPTDDPVLSQERELRVAELSAQLDAYTGGWYSKKFQS